APFTLSTYEQVAKRAEWIASITEERIMPPWIPHPSGEGFVGERWLSDHELKLLRRWAETGRARGDERDLPPRPAFAEGWRLGEPDLVVRMQEPFTVYANGPDLFQNFVIPIDIRNDRMVSAIEFHPGNNRVVHHCVLFLDSNGVARRLDEATTEVGYANFGGPGFAPTGALGGWSVGNTPRHLPKGMGRYLKQASDLVMQIHYHPTGKEEVDQSEVGLYFIDKPVEETLKEPAKLVGSIWMANYEMDIPADERSYHRSTSYTLPKDVILVGVVPHMHLLGKSMKVAAEIPNGEGPAVEKTLIDVRNWNYNWQDEYYYQQPFELPAGTKLTVDAVFDNSADNPSNPSSPPQRVTWGDETDDEMLFCFFLLSAEKTEDLIHVIYDNLQHDMRQPRLETTGAEEN
ncbi:MAG: alkyl hydroperoxide reductase, partial [Planctomycetota bacterium]